MSNPTSNTFSDFPPEEFTLLAFCESCGPVSIPEGPDRSGSDETVAVLRVRIEAMWGKWHWRVRAEVSSS